MAELKTQPHDGSVTEFLDSVDNESRREDAYRLLNMITEATGESPVMWGSSIVGFGRYRYRYASGRTGEWFVIGFSPRKSNLTLYTMGCFSEFKELLNRLGNVRSGKACVYLPRLDKIDIDVLQELIEKSVTAARELDISQDQCK